LQTEPLPEQLTAPPRWTLAELQSARLPSDVIVWATPSVAARARDALPYKVVVPERGSTLPAGCSTLIVIGGGTLIDRAKWLRREQHLPLRLFACASVWGSGAEVSPIAVIDCEGKKLITLGEGVAPDVRVVWPELVATLSEAAVRRACGDVWTHAVEALLSPLASDASVRASGALLSRMIETKVAADPRWFDLGAEACLLQAASSVGLVHGIAHVLEGPLASAHPELGVHAGHAALCAAYLWPVLRLLRTLSPTFGERCAQGGVDEAAVLAAARALHDPELYARTLPLLEAHWKSVLRDPCTRTSCALIRPNAIDFFREQTEA
jgi:hypothetical protein